MFSRVENEDQSYRIMMMSSIVRKPLKSEAMFIIPMYIISCAWLRILKKTEGDVIQSHHASFSLHYTY